MVVPLVLAALTLRRGAPGAPVLPGAFGALLALLLLQHLALGSEPLRFLKHPGPSPRLAVAQGVIRRIPADAPLAVTSQLAVHVPLRQQLYHFPGNASYDPALVDRARFILADRQRSTEESQAIDRLARDPGWRVVTDEGDFVLLERTGNVPR